MASSRHSETTSLTRAPARTRERSDVAIPGRHSSNGHEVGRPVPRDSMNAAAASLGPLDRISSRQLLEEVTAESRRLIREEVGLVKAEVRGVRDRAKGIALSYAIGAAALGVALLTGAATMVLLLALVVPAWAAAAIVFGGFLALGMVTILEASSRLHKLEERPKAVIASLERDVAWLDHLVRWVRAERGARA